MQWMCSKVGTLLGAKSNVCHVVRPEVPEFGGPVEQSH